MDGNASAAPSLVDDLHLFGDAVDALDHVLQFHGVEISKALDPLIPGDQAKISRRFARALRNAVAGDEARALRSAIDTLDVDWTKIDATRRDRIIRAARNRVKQLTVNNAVPKVERTFRTNAKKLIGDSKASSIKTHRLQINATFSDFDVQSARFLANSTANFVTSEYGKRADAFGKVVRDIVARGAERGAGPREIVGDLKKLNLGSLGRGDFYWEVVALSFTNRARTFGEISSFQEAGITRYVWESVLDEVTTETCRFLHNKTFPTEDAVGLVGRVEQAERPEDIKVLQPWISRGVDDKGNPHLFYRDAGGNKREVAQITSSAVGKPDQIGTFRGGMSEKQLLDSGLSMPPIHGLCRSTVVPDLSSSPPVRTLPTQPDPPPPPRRRMRRRPPEARKPPPERGKPPVKRGPNGRELPTNAHIKTFASDLNNRDTELVLEAIDEIGGLELAKRAPIGRMVFTNKQLMRSTKFTNTINGNHGGVYYRELRSPITGNLNEDSVLKLNAKTKVHVTGKSYNDPSAPWTVSTTTKNKVESMKATVVHEFGHHVHLTGYARNRDHQTGAFQDVDKVVRKAWRNRQQGQRTMVSEYAMTNEREYFAESFTLHWLAPDTLRARDPVAFDMVEQVRKLRNMGSVKR